LSSAVLYLAIVAIWVGVLVPRWLRRAHPAASDRPAGQSDDAQASAEPGRDSRSGWPAEPGTEADTAGPGDPAGTQFAPAPTYLDAGEAQYAADSGYEEPGAARPAVPADSWPARRPVSSAHVIQARRRMLTMLVTVAIGAAACTAAHLTRWWVCIPVAGMLVFYLMLLRAAAIAGAEKGRLRAEALQRAGYQRAPVRQAWAALRPVPVAEIIDISAMVRDQLYDQYADDTVRAVGD
jgi:hypothetical protein